MPQRGKMSVENFQYPHLLSPGGAEYVVLEMINRYSAPPRLNNVHTFVATDILPLLGIHLSNYNNFPFTKPLSRSIMNQ